MKTQIILGLLKKHISHEAFVFSEVTDDFNMIESQFLLTFGPSFTAYIVAHRPNFKLGPSHLLKHGSSVVLALLLPSLAPTLPQSALLLLRGFGTGMECTPQNELWTNVLGLHSAHLCFCTTGL